MNHTNTDTARWPWVIVLGLAIFGYWQPHPPALRWAMVAAVSAGAWTLVHAALNRSKLRAMPPNSEKCAWISTHLVGPVLVILTGVSALLGYHADLGLFMAVMVAILSLW